MSAKKKKRARKPAASKKLADARGLHRRRTGGAAERAEGTRKQVEEADRATDAAALGRLVGLPLPSVDGLPQAIGALMQAIEVAAPEVSGDRILATESAARAIETALATVWEHPLLRRIGSNGPHGPDLDVDEIAEEYGVVVGAGMDALFRALFLTKAELERRQADTYVYTVFPPAILDYLRAALRAFLAEATTDGPAAPPSSEGFVADPWEQLPPTQEQLAHYERYLREEREALPPVRRSDADLMRTYLADVAASASELLLRALALRGAETLRLALALQSECPEGVEPRIEGFVPLEDSECRRLLDWADPGTARTRDRLARDFRWIVDHGEPELSRLARAELLRVVERGPYVTAGDRALEIAARMVRERWGAKAPANEARETLDVKKGVVEDRGTTLARRELEFLKALDELNGRDQLSAKSCAEIEEAAYGQGNGNLKSVGPELKRRGLVDARPSRGGGYWLTLAGKKALEDAQPRSLEQS